MFQVPRAQGDAAGGRLEVFVGEMKEDGAAAPDCPRPDVEIDHADDVIEAILAPQRFGAGAKRQPDGPVVGARGRVVAPAVMGADVSLPSQSGAPAIGAPQPAKDRKAPNGGDAIALPTLAADAAPADGACDQGRTDAHHPPGVLCEARKLLNVKNVDFCARFAAAFQHGVLTAGTRERRFLTCHGFARWVGAISSVIQAEHRIVHVASPFDLDR